MLKLSLVQSFIIFLFFLEICIISTNYPSSLVSKRYPFNICFHFTNLQRLYIIK